MQLTTSTKACVAIIGAGTQGRRLAYMWSSRGNDVSLVDAKPSQLKDSALEVERLRAVYGLPVPGGKIHTFTSTKLQEALRRAWLVVECVPERLPLKQEVMCQLDKMAPTAAIIASNSSSFSCGEVMKGLTLQHRSRILSAHTYFPPETPAIEIMGHSETDPAHVETMLTRCAEHGFTPFYVRAPSMGYIYNRIWAAIKREALLTAADGAATPQEIDAIFKDVLQTKKGPFELMDTVGLDVVLDIENHYASVRMGIPEEPREYLRKMLEMGHLGVKAGRGFYSYEQAPIPTE